MNKHLSYLRAELELAHTHKFMVSGMVSHDLKTPITGISLSVEMMMKALQQQQIERFFQQASRHVMNIKGLLDRMVRFISDVLDTVTLEDKDILLNRSDIALHDIIKTSIEELTQFAHHKAQSIQLHIETDVFIQGDALRLRQVVDNLLSNAIKYAPFGDTIGVCLSANDQRCTLSITDHGQGIQSDEMHKLFRPFERLSSIPTGNEKSHGIGLNIVKKIVELHQGSVRCESVPSIETTFYVSLPITGDDGNA